MKISIIIPTYKGHDSIRIAIQSILKQKYNDYEILVCDDNPINSEDQILTEKCINSFNNSKIIYIKNDHKNGSAARNAGIKNSSGDIISLLDDDDFFLDGYLNITNDYFTEHPDIDLLFFDVNIITNHGISRKVSCPNITPKGLLFSNQEIGTGSNICFRKTISNELLFDERYIRHQDIEFTTKYMHKHKYYWLQDTKIVKYYNNTNNFPNVVTALEMQKLLREDMVINNIISTDESKELELKQLNLLYNDLLIRKSPLIEIKKIKNILIEKNNFSLLKRTMFMIYSISKSLFCFIAKLFINNNQNRLSDSELKESINYHNQLNTRIE